MKKINYAGILLLFVFSTSFLQAQDRSYYTLSVQDVSQKNITFINNSNLEVKVVLYKESDKVMLVGLESFTIKPGKSKTYKMGVYNVKIFKPQLIDKHLFTKQNVSGNLRMSGTEKKFNAVRLTTRKNTTFKNLTGEKVEICLYKRTDDSRLIAMDCYKLKDNTSTAVYSGDEKSFFVKVSLDGLFDKMVITQLCPDQSIITVRKVN